MLPVHPQGLGTGGRLLLTRQACPAVILSVYKDRSRSQWKTACAVFAARTYFNYTTFGDTAPFFFLKSTDITLLFGWIDVGSLSVYDIYRQFLRACLISEDSLFSENIHSDENVRRNNTVCIASRTAQIKRCPKMTIGRF